MSQRTTVHRHWADSPSGVHADRVWISDRSWTTSYDDGEEVFETSFPPSDMLRILGSLPFKPYVYGASPERLRPLDKNGIPKKQPEADPDWKPTPRVRPKPKPVSVERDPDTYKAPAPLPIPVDRPKKSKRERRLERENSQLKRELDQVLDRLEQAASAVRTADPVPLFVQPFVCSGCDPASPMFLTTHVRCSGGDCACYQQTPQLHDENRR